MQYAILQYDIRHALGGGEKVADFTPERPCAV